MTEKGPNYFIANQEDARKKRALKLEKDKQEEKKIFANKLRSYFTHCVETKKFSPDHILTVPEICKALGLDKTELFKKIKSLFPGLSIKQILQRTNLPFEEKIAVADVAFSKESIHRWFIDTARNNNRKPPTQQQVSQAVIDGLLPPQEEFKKITGYTLIEYKKRFRAKVELGDYAL